ncbi:MAG: hypothetical protein GKR77_00535 [Legionellales bacterium]|nr:hypothetical protein [Legionellales bacterium]
MKKSIIKNYRFEANRLIISTSDSIKKVILPLAIEEVKCFEDMLVVLLDYSMDEIFNENVFGISAEGKVLWQIEKIFHAYEHSPFTNIGQKNDLLSAYNVEGYNYFVDLKTGKIVDKEFIK